MLVYESTKKEFMDSVKDKSITHKIYDIYRTKIGRSIQSQINSWTNSMEYMVEVLDTPNIPDNSGIAIEFIIPMTSNRIDFIITGIDDEKNGNIIIIELKQWQEAYKVNDMDGIVKTRLGKGGGLHETNHPSYQVWSYYHLLMEYSQTLREEKISLYPCAYLHNFEEKNTSELKDPIYKMYTDFAPIYLKGDCLILRKFIEAHIKEGDNKVLLFKLDEGKIKPSKTLQDVLSRMLKGNQEFILIDNQKVIFEKAMNLAKLSKQDNKKRTIIVEGGPGTGKSVVAVNLLVELNSKKNNIFTQYVSKNAAPRNVYTKKLRGEYKQDYISKLFTGSGAFVNCAPNLFDALVIDEAHRLNAKSGMYKNLGDNQIKELIKSSKFNIFFIDENQRIDISDIGSKEEIERHAKEAESEVHHYKLESQFRCNGSDGYLLWLDDILQINETANFDGFDLKYDFKVFDDPEELKRAIEEKNKINNKSRMVAGYCWNWITKNKSTPNLYDVSIAETNFKMKWNLSNTSTWAIDMSSVNEIGCIHTCQGLEFDYIGVIFGEDIRFDNNKIITDYTKRARTDQSLKGIKKIALENPGKAKKIADQIIKNTYRTLMTRGQKGCYIYCCDKPLANYIKRRIENIGSKTDLKEILK